MTDLNSLLERADRAASHVPLPEDGLEHVLRRHDRRRRNQRVGALATVGLIVVVFAALAVRWLPDGATRTAGNPRPTSDPIGTIPDSIAAPESVTPPTLLVDLDGGRPRPLPKAFEGGFQFDVSPDGTQVAFTRDAENTTCCGVDGDGYVANLDGTGIRQVTSSPTSVDAWGLHWSPDGRLLAYQGLDASVPKGGIGDLFVIDVATGQVAQVTHLDYEWRQDWGRFLAPSFTPDGSKILFHLPRSGLAWDLWTVPVTGGEPTLLRRNAEGGAYSPDGGSLAFLTSPVRGDLTTVALQVIDAEGGEPRTLAEGVALGSPWWSPDGTMVAYVKDTTTYVVDVATGESHQILRGAGHEDWLDDDTLLVFRADEIR